MAPKKRKLSSLIESQLPGFIINEYDNFSKFIEKYYEQQESVGQPVDIITNLNKYTDIDTYEKNLLQQETSLVANINADASTLTVLDADSFPKENGYIKIGEEILFYQSRSGNTLQQVSRGVSGNTTLGDLYNESRFVTTSAAPHYTGDVVYNISNLFLYALVKEFEKTYLSSFPEAYLKQEVDKRLLIKNITKFYKAKGTDRSIKFIFNSVVSSESSDIPEVMSPKDYTLKASTSGWVKDTFLKVRISSGNPNDLIGKIITQNRDPYDERIQFASAVVDTVIFEGTDGYDNLYKLIVEPASINGNFFIAGRTTSTVALNASAVAGDRITVKSTLGFPKSGRLLIGDELIIYNDKTVNQFIISERVGPIRNHTDNKTVYSYLDISSDTNVRMISLGMVYGMNPGVYTKPYSITGESLEVSDPGFETLDPIIWDSLLKRNRWFVNTNNTVATVKGVGQKFLSDVSAVFQDDQYYYVSSSSFPSQDTLVNTSYSETVSDQKNLKLIRKVPSNTTEVYSTSDRDVGVFFDGVPALSYKDTSFIKKGSIETVSITNKGTSYVASPFVLINETTNLARCTLSGSTIDNIEILTNQSFDEDPVIRITSGEGAVLSPVVTNGAITSMDIINPGRYYSSPPIIRIADTLGKGGFAEFESVVGLDGSIIEARKISAGRFYTNGNVTVQVESVGKNASAVCEIKKWVYNRYEKFKNNLDTNNGTVFPSFEDNRGFGYGYVANPDKLRERCYLNSGNYTTNKTAENVHSPIIGYAFDGNPIYGPYGYSNPTNPASSVLRLSSGYSLKNVRLNGPDSGKYPLGSFIDDYEWIPSINSGKTELDANNGRFCITPEYPEGTYAYFITISDSSGTPAFPYILGNNFYSLPVDSNYNSKISQDDIPLNVKVLKNSSLEKNGTAFIGTIKDVKSGNVNSTYVEQTGDYFSPGKQVFLDESGTSGFGAVINVESVHGRSVDNIESVESKAVKVSTIQSAYFFEGDKIFQIGADGISQVQGNVIRDVINENTFVMRDVTGSGKFNVEENVTIESERLVQRLIIDTDASFTAGSSIRLTNDDDEDVASGIILESTSRQNSLIIKVDDKTKPFYITSDYYLRSSTLSDTNRAKVVGENSLSSGLTAFEVDDNIAIVETDDNHLLGVGDKVNVNILPLDSSTTTTFYVRKRRYQVAEALAPVNNSTLNENGVGSFSIMNSGSAYVDGSYPNVELIFQDSGAARQNIGKTGDPNNAKATIEVSAAGGGSVVTVIITDRGKGYRSGDVLTVKDSDLNRSVLATVSARFVLEVDHVGLAASNTTLTLSNVNNISREDFIQIGPEILKVTNVDVTTKEVTVERGREGTTPTNHFLDAKVTSYNSFFRFDDGFRPFGEGLLKPFLLSYDKETQKINVAFDYSTSNPQVLSQSSSFFDNSVPRKLVKMKTVQSAVFNLEFSTDNTNFDVNPIINIQKYYRYTFDVSHISMVDTFLDFSASANYNLFTEEKETSGISPGNAGAFLSIKLGFGAATYNNSYDTEKSINFQNYFYFIRVSPDVDTSGSFLRIIEDPLSGTKNINYVTPTKFVYSLDNVPAYDGSGNMTYTTTSNLAVGGVSSLRVVNTGQNYNLIPTVKGILPASANEAQIDPIYDPIGKVVTGFNIISGGSNYSKPVAVVTDGDGVDYEYECSVSDGNLTQIRVISFGSDFTFKPIVRIIESDVKIYLESNTIGIPKNVKINDPGKGFNADTSTQSYFKSPTTFVLRNISSKFFGGEKIQQLSTGAYAYVINNGWREGSNLLKVVGITGVFTNNDQIISSLGGRTATLHAQLCTEFDPDIKPVIDNFGAFISDRGKLSSNNQRLQDSYYFQDYSYVLRSKTSIEVWRDLIKETTHPAGFQLFGEMVIESEAAADMPETASTISHYSVIELAPIEVKVLDEPDNYKRTTITVASTRVKNLLIEDGVGSVSVDTFDTSETNTYRVSLTPAFDGKFDPNTGQIIGTKSFTLVDDATGNALQLDNNQQLVVTLDGIFQEPGISYNINGSSITFPTAPFGDRIIEGQEVDSIKFYGSAIKFKNNTLNTRYFKKLKSIGNQFDGVQFEFDLYYEDDSIVKTDVNENLIVALNGVVQKAKQTPETPFGNSYVIIRDEDSSVTDKIRFSKAPIDNEDLYGPPEEIPEELKTYEKCFIYSLGNYERLSVNSDLYEYRFAGPYLIENEVTRQVRKVDDSSYALVFIDGVLQREGYSYTIVGPNITFTEPLRSYVDSSGKRFTQDVNIILMYGRDVPRTLTFYDFEPNTFNNSLLVTLEGTDICNNFEEVYDPKSSSSRVYFEQGSTIVGKLLSYSKLSSDKILITFANPKNVVLTSDDKISICDLNSVDQYGVSYKEDIPGSYTVSYVYKTDDDGDRVLERNVPSWLYGLARGNETWNNRYSMFANLIPGDKILIDGESKYRTVTETPDSAKTTTYLDNDYAQSNFYAKAEVTDYNGDTEGVGLSITANLKSGIVQTLNVSDVEWNQRDLKLYFEEGILLQPTAYEYYTTPEIHFIPVDGKGGGASAEVIAYGGQILDVILTSGGSGYTQPPKVVVARRYKRIKEGSRKVDTLIELGFNNIISIGSPITSISEIVISGDGDTNAIFSLVTFGVTGSVEDTGRVITTTVNTLAGEENQVLMTDEKFPTEARVQSPTVIVEYEQPPVEPQITQIIGGVAGFQVINTVQSIKAEELVKIIEIPAIKAFRYQEKTASINGVGTFLDAPLSESDTIVYVPNTDRFPDTPSRIRIGREVLFYRQKEEDRFLNVIRGHQNTIVSSHSPGDLVLHDPEFVTMLTGGVSEVQTIVSTAQSSVTTIEKKVEIQSITNVLVEDVEFNVVNQFQVEAPSDINYDVIEQIIIIPPTSYNVVTSVHSTTSRISTATVTPPQIDGFVSSKIVTVQDTDIQLTQEDQIQIVPSGTITSVSIGSIAATAASTSQVVTTAYEATVHTHECSIDVKNTITNVNVEVLENVQSTVRSLTSVIGSIVEIDVNAESIVTIDSEGSHGAITTRSFVKSLIQDIDTVTTTFSMLVGSGLGEGGSSIEIPYKFAITDFIIEEYVLETNVLQRNGNRVILADPYNEVIMRNGSLFLVENRNQNVPPGFEDYNLGNAGLSLGSFEKNALVDTGLNSGLTIADLDTIYPTLSIRDFEFRKESALIANGDRFNLAIPTLQLPVTISGATGSIGGPLIVQNTTNFDDEGYLFTSSGSVIQYTSKTGVTFEGCTLVRGPSTITLGDDLIPFTLV